MKYLLSALVLLFAATSLPAQIVDPVKWSYSAVKKSDKEYLVKITAVLPHPWHIYSTKTPDGGPIPTEVSFKSNPLVTVDGSLKETGALKTEHDANFGVDVKYFDDKVEYTQTVKLKAAVKTNISGSVKYMVCNDKQCLPPKTVPFDVKLQ